jgi:uncharacterized protein
MSRASETTNPFRYGALALDEAFADREVEIAELRSDITNGQDVVILAPRRYGKSSLVWRVEQELLAKRTLIAHVDLMTTPTREKLAEKLAKTIHEDIASRLYRARERALAVFRGLRITPKITLDPSDGSVSFGFDTGYSAEDVAATLERLFELPGELAADRRRKAALVLDEFQEVIEIDPHLPKLMRAVFQAQPEVAHVYLGSKRHMMERIFNDENEPFWRSAKQIELSFIPPGLFANFVLRRFRQTGKEIEHEAAKRILGLTLGHPYATQELCYFTWEATPNEGAATVDQVRDGLAGLLRSEHAHFSLIWENSSAMQRLLLEALAVEAGRPYTAEYRRRHRLPAPTNVQKALTALIAQELVVRDPAGIVKIAEPFFDEWIRRNIEQLRPFPD